MTVSVNRYKGLEVNVNGADALARVSMQRNLPRRSCQIRPPTPTPGPSKG